MKIKGCVKNGIVKIVEKIYKVVIDSRILFLVMILFLCNDLGL